MYRLCDFAQCFSGNPKGGFFVKKNQWIAALLALAMLLAMVPAAAFAEGPASGGSSVVIIQDTDTWYGDATKAFDTLETFWNDQVEEKPDSYSQDDSANTVSIGSAEALVWWAKQVNAGTPFAGYTVNITADINLSAHYWTPICTGTVSYSADGKYSIAGNQVLENTVINGNGHTITGLTTQTGVRGPNQDSEPGDGQNCYYDAAFIGYSCNNITFRDISFSGARIAISEPFEAVTQQHGSSMIAVVVGAQYNGSLTLENVAVKGAKVLAMQKASAFVGNLMGSSTLSVKNCEISDSTFSAFFMIAPIAAYGKAEQVTVEGIRLANNTIEVVEMDGNDYAVDPDTGAEYWRSELNACTTALFYDGANATGTGTVLDLAAEFNGYYYPTLADAVAAVVASDSKIGTVTLLKDSQGGGIGLFNSKGAVGVDLTIDLGGHTYTCTGPSVGSVGTESQGFHLEKGNKVTVKNGAIAVSEASANTKMLFQNYCDLTLQDLSLTGAAVTQYIISCNYGDTTLTNVSINGTHSQLVALDVMHWLNESYKDKAPTVTVNNTEANTINGAMDVYCYGTGADSCTQKPTLSITGGKFSADPSSYVAEGYVVSGSDSEGYVVTKYVAPTPVPTQAPEQGGSTTPVPTAVPAPTATPKPLATARPVATATPVPSEAPVVNEAGAVVVSTTTEAQVTESAAAAVVEKDQLAEAVAEAVAEAQKAGAAPAVRVEVTAAEDAASVAVTLPSEALTELAKEEGATLVVTSDVAEVSFDSVALSAIVEQAKEEIILKVEPVQESALSEAQAQTANGQPIFELTLQSGGEVISDFKTGNATIKIPYTLAEGQQAEGVVVWYLDEDGNTTPCETSYDEAAGMVTFVTPHFSKYVIGYDETLVPAAPEVSEPVTQPPVEETTADGAKLPVLPIAIGCVAVVLVVLVVVLRKLFAGKNDESRGY